MKSGNGEKSIASIKTNPDFSIPPQGTKHKNPKGLTEGGGRTPKRIISRLQVRPYWPASLELDSSTSTCKSLRGTGKRWS